MPFQQILQHIDSRHLKRCRALSEVASQVMDREEHLVSAVHWLDINLSFDLDVRVHVFELTIRALGEPVQLWSPA